MSKLLKLLVFTLTLGREMLVPSQFIVKLHLADITGSQLTADRLTIIIEVHCNSIMPLCS